MKRPAVSICLIFVAHLLCVNWAVAQRDDSVQSHQKFEISHRPLPARTNYLNPKSLILPVAMIDFGISSLNNEELQEFNKAVSKTVTESAPAFRTKVDDYLKYAPVATVYLLNAVGIKGEHKILDRTIILVMSSILANQVVTMLKHGTHQLRPDGSTYNSFPSGHTTTAFIGAEIMHQEFGSKSPWYSVAGYSVATGTALLRVMNNRHWLSDVITGAGIGMITTKFSYWVYSKWENRKARKQLLLY